MNFLANDPQPEGPTDKLCPSEEPNEAKQAYPRRDGRQRSRWKDGSHDLVESRHANDSRRDGLIPEPKPRTEPLVTVSPLLGWNHERKISTRDRPARTGADARIEESAAREGSPPRVFAFLCEPVARMVGFRAYSGCPNRAPRLERF